MRDYSEHSGLPTTLVERGSFTSLASESVVPRHAMRIKALKSEWVEIEAEAAELADSLPLLQVLTSMPGVGLKTAFQILLAAGDFSAFKTAGHLAAYAGITPGGQAVGKIDSQECFRRGQATDD